MNATIRGAGYTQVYADWRADFAYVIPCGPGGPYFTEIGYYQGKIDDNCEPDGRRRRGPNVSENETNNSVGTSIFEPPCGSCRYQQFPVVYGKYIVVKPKIQIMRDGQATDITGTTQNATVGQQINLSTVINGGSSSSQQWTVPGKVISNYVVVCNGTPSPPNGIYCINPSSATPQPVVNFNNQSLNFYWWDGGSSRQVQFQATVKGATNQVYVTYNVSAPTATIQVGGQSSGTQRGPIFVEQNSSGKWFLSHGDVFDPGVKFVANVTLPAGVTGFGQWVQTYNISHRLKLPNDSWVRVSGSGLDRTYPYSYTTELNDSPRQALSGENVNNTIQDFTRAEINDSATSWFMFKPDLPNSIWVPIKQIQWTLYATADRQTNGTYQKTGESAPNPTLVSDISIEFPVWAYNITL